MTTPFGVVISACQRIRWEQSTVAPLVVGHALLSVPLETVCSQGEAASCRMKCGANEKGQKMPAFRCFFAPLFQPGMLLRSGSSVKWSMVVTPSLKDSDTYHVPSVPHQPP